MSKLFDQAIARVKKLPAEEQEMAAHMLLGYLGDRQDVRLSEQQLAEVRRRRADPDAVHVSHDEARAFVKRLIS